MTKNVHPMLRYRDARAAIDWLAQAFGLRCQAVHDESADGSIVHAELRHGDGVVMLGSWRGEQDLRAPGQGWAYVSVADPDEHMRRARAAGAEIVAGPDHQDYGSFYSARDPEGNLWSFGTYDPADIGN
jgi:uncharacterized glyoxalase superfamily protein PhnB